MIYIFYLSIQWLRPTVAFPFRKWPDSVFGLAALTTRIETFSLSGLCFVILGSDYIGMYGVHIIYCFSAREQGLFLAWLSLKFFCIFRRSEFFWFRKVCLLLPQPNSSFSADRQTSALLAFSVNGKGSYNKGHTEGIRNSLFHKRRDRPGFLE